MASNPEENLEVIPVSSLEWKQAHNYFQQNQGQAKIPRGTEINGVKLEHSFIQAGGKLYAMQTVSCSDTDESKGVVLGQGAFGKVRLAIGEDNTMVAVKVEGSGPSLSQNAETKIMQELGVLHGQNVRASEKQFLGQNIHHKKYSVMTLIPGQELFKQLHGASQAEELPYADRMNIGLASIRAVKFLHDRGVLHCDLKAQNIMVKKNDDQSFTATAIDFGAARQLSKMGFDIGPLKLSKFSSKSPGRVDESTAGTHGFIAPEIKGNTPPYSKASDIYALGVMLKVQLGIQEPIVDQMLEAEPSKRPNIKKVIETLNFAKYKDQLGVDDHKPVQPQLNNYPNLSDQEKLGVICFLANIQTGSSLVDYKKIDFNTINLQSLVAIRADLEKQLDNEPKKWHKDHFPQIKNALEVIIVQHALKNSTSPDQAYETLNNIDGFDMIKNRVGVPVRLIAKEYNNLENQGLSDDERKQRLQEYVDKYDYGSLNPESVKTLKELVDVQYGLSAKKDIDISHTSAKSNTSDSRGEKKAKAKSLLGDALKLDSAKQSDLENKTSSKKSIK